MLNQIGDRVIAGVARRLKEAVPENCLLARYGGDEFVILVSYPCLKDELYRVAQQLLQSLQIAYVIDNYEFHLSVSIGIACYPFDGEDVDILLKNDDVAMYKAKETRDEEYNIKFFTEEMGEEVRERFSLETHLTKALEKEEFSLCFQPIVNIRESGQYEGNRRKLAKNKKTGDKNSRGRFRYGLFLVLVLCLQAFITSMHLSMCQMKTLW